MLLAVPYLRTVPMTAYEIDFPNLPFCRRDCRRMVKAAWYHAEEGQMKRKHRPHVTEALESLLPSKEDTDALVSFYLEHLEQIHRVVHIPTFQQEYALFWVPGRPRDPTFVALVLAILALSSPPSTSSSASAHRSMPPKWISACDGWLSQQNFKICRLTHYQVLCLVHLGKRLNAIKKKWFWFDTSTPIHTAVMDTLHRDPSPPFNSPFMVCDYPCRFFPVSA
jgi:hypothetical protein